MRTAVLYGSPKRHAEQISKTQLIARPTPANQSEKRERKEGRSRYSCCVIGSRNRLRNLFEGVSRAIFNADSEYAKGFL